MKEYMLQLLRLVIVLFAGLLGLFLLYLLLAVILSAIPVNRKFTEARQRDVPIYLLSNGVHLDIVVPKVSPDKDWRKELQISPLIEEQVHLVAFGWGDRAFYLNTPVWSDLRFSTAFNALFLRDSAAMHVSYFRGLSEGNRCIELHVTAQQYQKLIRFIENSLQRNNEGQAIPIENAGYSRFDQFYEANRSYYLFYTCNTWSNQALKQSGLRSCLWTPFDRGILWQNRMY